MIELLRRWILVAMVLTAMTWAPSASAQPAPPDPEHDQPQFVPPTWRLTLFFEMDYWEPPQEQTARMFIFARGGLVPLAPHPQDARISRFEWIGIHPRVQPRQSVWLRTVEQIGVYRVIAGRPHETTDPAYTGMVHHLVLGAGPLRSGRTAADPDGRIWPVVVDGSLTGYDLREAGDFGMRFASQDAFAPALWRWHNPGGVRPEETVMVGVTLWLEFFNEADEHHRRDVNVSVVSAATEGELFLCLTGDGEEIVEGPALAVEGMASRRIVAAIPFLGHHGQWLELRRGDEALHRAIPQLGVGEAGDVEAVVTIHDCPESPAAGVHAHPHHRGPGSLAAAVWTPGAEGPLVEPGATLSVAGKWVVPQDDPCVRADTGEASPVESAGFYLVFWTVEKEAVAGDDDAD